MSTTVSQTFKPPANAVNLLASDQKAKEGQEALQRFHESAQAVQQAAADPEHIQCVSEDSVVIQVPQEDETGKDTRKGMVIEVGPPPASTVFLVSSILATAVDQDMNVMKHQTDANTVKTLLYVRAINGKVVPQIQDIASAKQLANVLGDKAIMSIQAIVAQYWTVQTQESIKVLKKNLRRS